MLGIVGGALTAGDTEANERDGRGERERAGVDVENAPTGPDESAARLCWGMERNSSDDLAHVGTF